MKSDAMRRVSSMVSGRAAPAGDNFPLISTSGGFPGEKNRSLTFSEVLSIAASKSLVEIRAGAAAAAAALVPADVFGDGEATGVGRFGIRFVGVDIMGRVCSRLSVFPRSRIFSISSSLVRGGFGQNGPFC